MTEKEARYTTVETFCAKYTITPERLTELVKSNAEGRVAKFLKASETHSVALDAVMSDAITFQAIRKAALDKEKTNE